MKKTTKPIRRKTAGKKTSRHHHHLRIISWAMAALAVFYLVSLAAIIRIYPEVFSISESYAQIQPTNLLQRSTAVPGTSSTSLQTESPKTIETNTAPRETSPTTVEKSTLPTSQTPTGTTTTLPIDSSSVNNTTKNVDSPNTTTTTTTTAPTPTTGTSAVGSPAVQIDTTKTSKATNISPELKFLNPAYGDKIKDKQVFAASVEAAQGVEFYITKKGSLTEQFLCSAKNLSGNNWKCEAQTSDVPNGEYKLIAKITNSYGSYKSSGITIKINNETASISSVFNSSSTKISSTTQPSSTTEPSSTTNLKNTAASGSKAAKQTAKVSAQEVKDVKEIVEKRSQEQNIQSSAAGNITSENATVAGSLSQQIDTDKDGISNDEEKRIDTDPNSADTDKDGYMDGDEIKNGFNPAKASTGGDKIAFESPKEKGEVKKELLGIESVGSIAKQTENAAGADKSAAGAEKEIQLKGKGLPNSFVTIYIYSETPTIVTVMTDENGNWAYTMDKSIENGQHEAYVAITDNEGHITAKSEPFFFVKTAQAATKASAEEIAVQNAASIQSPVAASRSKQVAVIGFVIIISLFTVIACIGLFLAYRYHHAKIEPVVRKDYLESK